MSFISNLEETIASLLQLAMEQPEGPPRDHLVDKVSELDSIGDVMRQALDAVANASVKESGISGRD